MLDVYAKCVEILCVTGLISCYHSESVADILVKLLDLLKHLDAWNESEHCSWEVVVRWDKAGIIRWTLLLMEVGPYHLVHHGLWLLKTIWQPGMQSFLSVMSTPNRVIHCTDGSFPSWFWVTDDNVCRLQLMSLGQRLVILTVIVARTLGSS